MAAPVTVANHEITNVTRLLVTNNTLLNINKASPDPGIAHKGEQAVAQVHGSAALICGANRDSASASLFAFQARNISHFVP